MEQIRQYVFSIFLISFVCGIVLLLAPDGNGRKLKKPTQFLTALCILLALLAPLRSGLRQLKNQLVSQSVAWPTADLSDSFSSSDRILEQSKKNMEDTIAEFISEQMRYEKERISVAVELNDEDLQSVKITAIIVRVKPVLHAIDRSNIELLLQKTFGSQTTITVYQEDF